MEVIVGNRTFDTDSLRCLCTRYSHSDLTPAREEPTGLFSRIDIFDAASVYLLAFAITHQRSEDEDDVVTSRGVIPLPVPLGQLVVAHITSDRLPPPEGRQSLESVVRDIDALIARLKAKDSTNTGLVDLIQDISEMRSCICVGACRGSLALAGRALESCLKATLRQEGIEFEDQ